jgi:hypothetical protein
MNWTPSEKVQASLQGIADTCDKPVYVHLAEDAEILIGNAAPPGFCIQLTVVYPNKK